MNENGDVVNGELQYQDSQPCEILSPHKARCTAGDGLFIRLIQIDTGNRDAKVRDAPGDLSRPVDVFSGPSSDDIELLHQDAVVLQDLGGNNRIRLGTGGGWIYDHDNYVTVGPGASVIDVRNNGVDHVRCFTDATLVGVPLPLSSPLDRVIANTRDVVLGCGQVERS